MHRQPIKRQHARAAPGPRPGRDDARAAAIYRKSAIEPWMVSGGSSYFLPEFTSEYFDVRGAGAQMICSVYIPKGTVGFLKQIRVAPFRPAVFNPLFLRCFAAAGEELDLMYGQWIGFNPESSPSDQPTRPSGVWETPFAWENYFDSYNLKSKPPSWRWYLRLIPGNIDDLRSHKTNLPDPASVPFTEPLTAGYLDSWYLVADVAVPAEVYPAGLPGSPIATPFDGQRVQVIQGDQLSAHLPIPENTTLALFCRWTQQPIEAVFAGSRISSEGGGAIELEARLNYTGQKYFPLLPSFGSLLGYSQSSHLLPGKKNAEYGWHG